jgi:rhodanese-related sulfurtransferase
MDKSTGFQKLVDDAKTRIKEISPSEAADQVRRGAALLIDVRENDEWEKGHAKDAIHLSRGTIELDIEEQVTDPNRTVICYCGGGGRSALAADNLQKMGYKNVRSLAGGFKAWNAAGLPTDK